MGEVWDVLYFEGNAPDVGKRRENFIVEMLRKEFPDEILSVEQAPSKEKGWDIKVTFQSSLVKRYNLKTTEGFSSIKMAWDGFPSEERFLSFEFKSNLLYVAKEGNKIKICVIDAETLNSLQREIKNNPSKLREYWSIPKENTNPRGFGLRRRTVKKPVEKFKNRGNYVEVEHKPFTGKEKVESQKEYFENWYDLVKKIAEKYHRGEKSDG
ncbi:hypothetical protein [Thermotoga sp. SG1]|uniref:hypothetical protein n=1 Tax=Thermotoga sp. SG1 TaxID=126739 RepID=UPI001E3FAEB7|nr:hypothetical protein [Thermotoga sp. SG1]